MPLLCSHETGGPGLLCLSATRHPPRLFHPPLRTLFFFSLPSVFFAALFLPCFGSLASRLFPPPLRLPPAPCAAPSDKTPFFPPLFPPPSSHPPLSPIYKYRPSSLSYIYKYRLQLSDRKSPRELLRARPPSRVHRPRLNGKPRPGLRFVRIRARCVEPCDCHTRRQIQHGCPWRGRR